MNNYIDIIIKRKNMILAIFLISVTATTIISLAKPEIYQATASIIVIPTDEEKLITSFFIRKTLLKSNIILERIVQRLKLTDRLGRTLNPDVLFRRLDVKKAKEPYLFQLEVKDINPKKAKDIANIWAQEYIKYNQEIILGKARVVNDFIADRVENAKEVLMQAEEKVKDFKDRHTIDFMWVEFDYNKAKLGEHKNKLIDLEFTIREKEGFLKELEKEMKKQEKLWAKRLNPIYQNLARSIANTKIELKTLKSKMEDLQSSIKLTESGLTVLAREIYEKEFELAQLFHEVEACKRTYDYLLDKAEARRISKMANLGEVKIVLPAVEPKSPIGLNRRQKIPSQG